MSDIAEELNCAICLNIYTDPVSLKCQHNFCQVCIESALDTQKVSGMFTCPECRAEYPERPSLEKNRKLRNIVESFLSAHKNPQKATISCTYCVKSSVPAVKTCLQCEISLCDDHLEAHNKMVDHILVEPTSSVMNKKCTIHKKPLEFYCTVDYSCLCTSCCLVGKHKGHQVVLLEEAAEQKKEKLRNLLAKVTPRKREIEKQVQNLQEHKRKVQENTSKETQRAKNLFRDIHKKLKAQEEQTLSKISRQEELILQSASNLIQELESQMDELSTKMSVIEELGNIADPLTLLQEQLPEIDEAWQDEGTDNTFPIPDLDRPLICLTIHKSINDFIKHVNSMTGTHIKEASDILLDGNTAHVNVVVSPDMKVASFSTTPQAKSELPGRFTHWSQVLSTDRFCRQHFWVIETSDSGVCEVGVCYASMGRKGDGSSIGDNNKSWSLRLTSGKYLAIHDSRSSEVSPKSSCQRIGIFLDYGSGHLSFYQMCNPIQHIHTFKTTFTEPLHAAFGVNDDAWVKIKG